ncbi:cytochrome c family protein [uncultured Brevundimonas sp.]|uniref:c-type cytochrome n=1 Tax=uncultured Brevundimonas sp. TaxID=213418 RepID=UPI0030EC6721|tara:strand:+ start:17616 stop:18290 length:675 start_codon:yes stop_codon:yes gene_type:complete
MSGDLKWNKIFGAGLGTVFAILVVQQVAGMVYKTDAPEKMGYFVDAPEEAAGGAEEVVLPPDWGTILPTADLAAGEAAFARCQACHTIAAGGANGVGPNLNGIVGRAVAGHAGFAYSDAMTGHTAVDATWTLDALDQFITAPTRYIPGTKMSFAGLRDTQTRVNLIAYLRSQGSAGFPIPAPDPARQPPVPGAEEPAAAPADGAEVPTDGVADTAAVQATPVAN